MINISTPTKGKWAQRNYEEEPQPNDVRSPFQHDRDRIIHSTAFRRLQYKTQVYIINEGDLYRTRLTHSLEVAQIARGLALELKANKDLAEAIAFAHDLGHAPFGHKGGEKLKQLLEERKIDLSFEHNIQSFKIVSDLEERYSRYKGLNLTHATLEGIIRHSTPFDSQTEIYSSLPYEIKTELLRYLNNSPQPSVETQIVNIADAIAYAAHDIEDGIAVGLLNMDLFEKRLNKEGINFILTNIFNKLQEHERIYRERNANIDDSLLLKVKIRMMSRFIIDFLMRDVQRQTEDNINKLLVNTQSTKKEILNKIRENKYPVVAFSDRVQEEVGKLINNILFNDIYREPRVMIMMQKAERIIEVLFNSFINEPKALPKVTQARLGNYFDLSDRYRKSKIGKRRLAQVVVNYISGMTDKYAMDMYQLLTQAYEKAL